MTYKKQTLILFLFSFFFLSEVPHAFSQAESEAKKFFASKDYINALDKYKLALKEKPKDWELLLNTGICILNINGDRKKAIEYLEKANYLKKNHFPILENLAMAYQYAEKYYEASKIYEELLIKAPPKIKPDLQIEADFCNRAREAVLNPKNVTFKNLGKKINSEFPDYYPMVPENNAFLAFTSRRKGNTGNVIAKDGYYTSDVYIVDFKNGNFQKAKNAGIKVNTLGDEQVTGFSSDGKNIVLYTDHGGSDFGNLSYCENQKNNNFIEPKNFADKINTNAMESSGSFNFDGSLFYFSSDKIGGNGGTDLYFSKRLPSGEWSDAENLGSKINTDFDEDFPIVSEDGTTLTFSSMGHNSIGGFDLFVSKWDTISNSWGEPENMGYPINTSADEMSFCFNKNKDSGYMSCWREDSNGDLDIYKVIFNDLVIPQSTYLYTTVIAGDTIHPYVRATCIVTDKITNDTIGIYNTKKNGTFLMILPVGLYKINIESKGFELYSQDLYVGGDDLYVEKDSKTFRLRMIGAPKEIEKPKENIKIEDKKIDSKPIEKDKKSGVLPTTEPKKKK